MTFLLALLLMLVGFALMTPRSGTGNPMTSRFLSIGWWRMPTRPERRYDGTTPWQYRLIRVLVGLALMAAGVLILALRTN